MKTLILLLLLLSTSPLTHSHTHSLTHPLPIQHESSETTPTPTAKRRTPLTPSLLHLVITRFQQYQPTLLSLGHARIHLFRSFCLPSMRAQTSQHFVWLILTDPSLHSSLRVEMQQLLAPYPHFFLLPHLGFVTSELFINGDMRGHELWSGSSDLWRSITVPKKPFQVYIHTRLDADDGLHRDFLGRLQTDSVHSFFPLYSHSRSRSVTTRIESVKVRARTRTRTGTVTQPLQWKYYCLIGEAGRRVLEWQFDASTSQQFSSNASKIGTLQPSIVEKKCISAGMTFAFVAVYSTGKSSLIKTNFSHGMHYPRHASLWSHVKSGSFGSCLRSHSSNSARGGGYDSCIESGVGGTEQLQYYALRSRTPTSTGMNRITADPHWPMTRWWLALHNWVRNSVSNGIESQDKVQNDFWQYVQEMFGVSNMSAVVATTQYFQVEMTRILQDAIAGHCKPDLTCKQDSLQKLKTLLRNTMHEAN